MHKVSLLQTTTISAIASGLLLVGLGSASVSRAEINSIEAASSICKAASGPGAKLFYFGAQNAQNTSTANQYITCGIQGLDRVYGSAPVRVIVHLENPTAAAVTFNCVVIAHHNGAVTQVAAYSVLVDANLDHFTFESGPSSTPVLPVKQADGFLAMSCLVPPQGKVVSIRMVAPGSIP